MRQAPLPLGGVAISAAALLGACSDNGAVDPRPWASGDAWIDVRLEIVSDPALHLGQLGDVVFGRHDFVYVNDRLRPDIVVLDSLLAPVATIGAKGEGPGEFLYKSRIQVLSGDSLLVFDGTLKRLTIFSEARFDLERVTAMPPFVDDLWRLPGLDRRHLVMDRPAFYAGDGGETDDEHVDVLSILDEAAQAMVAEAFLGVPQPAMLVVRSGGHLRVSAHPYPYVNIFEMLPGGGFIHLNGRALAATLFDNDGLQTGSFSYPTIPIPVPPEHFADRLAKLNQAEARLLREGAPYTLAAVSGMIVDDDGRIWIGIPQPEDVHREWRERAAFTQDGHHVASMRLPNGVTPRAIRGHKLLATAHDEFDVPEIRLYRILWKDGQT